MAMKRNTKASILFTIMIIIYIILSKDGQHLNNMHSRLRSVRYSREFAPLFDSFGKCFDNQSYLLTGDLEIMWVQIDKVISKCDGVFHSKLHIKDYQNRDETKRHIHPKPTVLEKSTIVTIGIGRDTDAETRLRSSLGAENVEFFGADPITTFNEELYNKLGQFFPYAVGANATNSTASVLENGKYQDKTVIHVGIIDFLKNMVKRTFIDNLWLDAEYAEYDMLHFFHKEGKFDENDITFCQINMEIHGPSYEQKLILKDFIFRLREEKRYAMVKTINIGHLRLYLVNMEDARCVEKYVLGP